MRRRTYDPRQEFWDIEWEPIDLNFWDCIAAIGTGIMVGITWFAMVV